MAGLLGAAALLGGVYYLSRLAPRVAQRASMAAGGRVPVRPYHRYEGAFQHVMSRREAMLLLGFTEDIARSAQRPAEKDVKTKYYALMKQLHGDVDGSPFVTTKLNEARDVLLRQ